MLILAINWDNILTLHHMLSLFNLDILHLTLALKQARVTRTARSHSGRKSSRRRSSRTRWTRNGTNRCSLSYATLTKTSCVLPSTTKIYSLQTVRQQPMNLINILHTVSKVLLTLCKIYCHVACVAQIFSVVRRFEFETFTTSRRRGRGRLWNDCRYKTSPAARSSLNLTCKCSENRNAWVADLFSRELLTVALLLLLLLRRLSVGFHCFKITLKCSLALSICVYTSLLVCCVDFTQQLRLWRCVDRVKLDVCLGEIIRCVSADCSVEFVPDEILVFD